MSDAHVYLLALELVQDLFARTWGKIARVRVQHDFYSSLPSGRSAAPFEEFVELYEACRRLSGLGEDERILDTQCMYQVE